MDTLLYGTVEISGLLLITLCVFSAIAGSLISKMDTDRQEKRLMRHLRRLERKIDALQDKIEDDPGPPPPRPAPPLVLTRGTRVAGVIEAVATPAAPKPQRVGDRPAFRRRINELAAAGGAR